MTEKYCARCDTIFFGDAYEKHKCYVIIIEPCSLDKEKWNEVIEAAAKIADNADKYAAEQIRKLKK